MSREIDERVVEMRFDNSNFEKNVDQSMSTIEKLKNSLSFKGATKGLEEIDSVSRNMDFSGLQNGVAQVSLKFSLLEAAALSALTNIINKAVDTGLHLVKSLTIDQITAGYNKFNDKVQSTATIMSATGKSVEEVEEQLQKLNWFTDETSASFTDMTNNIGKFTNAGVPLETAVTAMQGISTWGYKSGATINEMGRAMYNLSQAMAVGSVKLMDWKSIENANMATTEFKQTAIDTAVAVGTLTKKVDANGQTFYKTLQGNTVTVTNFNAALSDAWFTSDVLTGALNSYGSFAVQLQEACEETGTYATEFIGYYQDYVDSIGTDSEKAAQVVADFAEETNTSVERASEIFEHLGYNSAYVDELAKSMVEASAKENKLELSTEELESKTNDLSDALEKAFFDNKKGVLDMDKAMEDTGLTADKLNDAFSKIAENTNDLGFAAFKASQEAKTLQEAIDATKDAVSTSWMNIFQTIFGNYEEAKAVWSKLSEDLYEIFVDPLNSFLHDMQEWSGKDVGGRQTLIDALSASMDNLKEVIAAVSEGFAEIFPPKTAEDIQNMVLKFESFTKAISLNSDELEQLKTGAKGVAAFLHAIGTVLKRVISLIIPTNSQLMSTKSGILGVIETIGNVLIKIDEWVENNHKLFDTLKDIREKLNGKLADIHILETISNLFSTISDKAATLSEKLSGLKDFNFSLKGIGDALKTIGTAIWDGIKNMFKNFSFSDLFEKVKKIDWSKVLKGAGFAGIILVINKLANSIKKFNPIKKITDSISDVLGQFGDVIDKFKEKLTGGKLEQLERIAGPILKFAIAIGILAIAFKVLGSMSWAEIGQAATSLTAIIGEFVGAMLLLSNFSGPMTTRKILQFSIAIGILTLCFKSLGQMSWAEIGRASVALLAVIGELTGAMLLIGNFGGIFAPRKVLQFSIAVGILTLCFKSLGQMSWAEIGRGTVALLAIIGELTGAFLLLGNFGGIFSPHKVLQLTISIGILTICFKSLAQLTDAQIENGSTALGFIINKIVGAFLLLGNFSGIFSPSKVLQVTLSIGILTICFNSLAKLTDAQIENGSTALGFIVNKIVEAFVLLGNFSGIFAPHKVVQVTTCIATLSACFIKLSEIPAEACKVAADAFNLITNKVITIFTYLGNNSGIFAPRKVAQVTASVKTLSDCFIDLAAIDAESEKVAADAFELITNKVVTIFTDLGNKSGIFAPKKVGQITSAIATLIDSFVKLAGFDPLMVDSAIKSIEINVPKISESVLSLSDIKNKSKDAVTVGDNFSQMAGKLATIDITIREKAISLNEAISTLSTIDTSGLSSVIDSIKTFADNLNSLGSLDFSAVTNSFQNVGQNIASAISTGIEGYDPTANVNNFITKINNGLQSGLSSVGTASKKIVNRIKSTFNGLSSSGSQIGKNLINGLISGMNSQSGALYNTAMRIVNEAIQKMKETSESHSPSRKTMELGKYLDEGLIVGMKALQSNVVRESGKVAGSSVDAFGEAISKIAEAVDTDLDYNPIITPVLDLSQIQNGVGLLNGMFGNPGLSVAGTANLVKQVGWSMPASNSRSYNSSSVNNLYIDGIKYNSDEYVDKSINDFVVSMIRKAKT